MLQSPRHPVPPLLPSQKKRGTPLPLLLHKTAMCREPQAGPAWLPGPSAQHLKPVALPESVCSCLAAAEPEARSTREQGWRRPAGRGGKINIEILARLTGLLQHELQPENNSTYSVLACLSSPYVFLFTNDSKKLNVHMNYSGGPNIVTCEQCMLSSCLNPQCNVCSFVVLQRPSYLMVPI